MSNEPLPEDFEFERLLKIIMPYISEDDLNSLQKWNFVYLSYQASWALFFSYSTEENAVEVKIKSDDLFAIEDTLNDVISSIFLETPDPKIVAGNWDGGKEKEIAQERENTIISIKKLTAECYAELRLQVSSIDEVVNGTAPGHMIQPVLADSGHTEMQKPNGDTSPGMAEQSVLDSSMAIDSEADKLGFDGHDTELKPKQKSNGKIQDSPVLGDNLDDLFDEGDS